MRITLPGKQLKALVRAGVSVSNPSDERQILRNLFLNVTDEGLEITATDTITGLWLKIPVSDSVVVKKTGRAVVNAQNLLRLVDTVAHKDVTLIATERAFRVEAAGSKFRLCVEDASDFPKIARFSSRKPFITIKAELLPKLIARTAFCAHDEASFQLMHGLLVTTGNNKLRMVATNGQRLAVSEMEFSQQSKPDEPFEEELVIPADATETVKRIIDSGVETIDIQMMTTFLNVRTIRGEVSIRALQGNYPIYNRGIPSALKSLTLDRRDLVEILKQTTAIKSPTTNFVALQFLSDRMVFSSYAEGAGDAEVEYEHVWEDDEHKITINPEFMIETLVAIRGDDVNFEVGNEMTPTILREMGVDNEIDSFCVFAVVRQ